MRTFCKPSEACLGIHFFCFPSCLLWGYEMGIVLGLISSATFGLIPLFALPLMAAGMTESVLLFYRFFFASITLGIILILRRERLYAGWRDLLQLAGMSLMYTMSAFCLLWGLGYVPSGVATTIQFLYPVMVMLIMTLFFHEKFSWITLGAVVLSITGVAVLSWHTGDNSTSSGIMRYIGVFLLLGSALSNAVYISCLHVARIKEMSGLVATFYVMFFSAFYALVNAGVSGEFRMLSGGWELGMLLLMALVTAVLSNFTLILAIKRIGSTLTSVLGAMEPVTAVFVGIMIFNEPFTARLVTGMVLILAAVTAVMLKPQIQVMAQHAQKLVLAKIAQKRLPHVPR